MNMVKRKIIEIDEDKCTGCGECVTKCAEGALAIIDGKAKVVNEVFCDGLGACIGECPEDALKIIERDAPEFDEEAVKGQDVLMAADCVPFALRDFHGRFLAGRPVIIGCPKLDEQQSYLEKLTDVISNSGLKSITIAHMEVPCCHGLQKIVTEAVRRSGKNIPA